MLQRYEVFPKSPLSLAKYFFKTNAADIRSGDVSGNFCARVFRSTKVRGPYTTWWSGRSGRR